MTQLSGTKVYEDGTCIHRWRRTVRRRGKTFTVCFWTIGWMVTFKPQERIWFSAVSDPLDWSVPVDATVTKPANDRRRLSKVGRQ